MNKEIDMGTSRNSHDLMPEAGATEHPSMRAKWGPAAALALGLVFVLGAGEAAAQGVCAGDMPTAPNSNLGGTRIVYRKTTRARAASGSTRRASPSP